MKYKVGDKVEIMRDTTSRHGKGHIGTITEIRGHSCRVSPGVEGNWSNLDDLKLASKRGRPKKEKQVKYIAIYDENDVDPVKKFYSRKETTEWIKEAKEDESIDFDSIEVYTVNEKLNIKIKTKVSLTK